MVGFAVDSYPADSDSRGSPSGGPGDTESAAFDCLCLPTAEVTSYAPAEVTSLLEAFWLR